jgi:hypothetical protein
MPLAAAIVKASMAVSRQYGKHAKTRMQAKEKERFVYRRRGKILPRGGQRQNLGESQAPICLKSGAALLACQVHCSGA